jgi:hypothetical protein
VTRSSATTDETLAGGKITSPEAFTRSGYGLPPVAIGGPQEVQMITCTRTDSDGGQVAELEADVGHTYYEAERQKLDVDSHPTGAPKIELTPSGP